MGKIHHDIRFDLLYPKFKDIVQVFLDTGFSLTNAVKLKSHGSEFIFSFLSSSTELKEMFNFEYEVLLVYHKYIPAEPRAFQAVDRYISSAPAKGRVENLVYFFVSEQLDIQDFVDSYMLEHKDERIVIAFNADNIISKGKDCIIQSIQQKYMSVNKFKDNLPIQSDTYYFGRELESTIAANSFLKKENIGVFGLRKTGKTSFLLKLIRQFQSERIKFIFLQAQDTKINMLRWNELLKFISQLMLPNDEDFSEPNAGESFAKILARGLECMDRFVLMIDEIEQLTPGTASEEHWKDDYRRFFQTIRSCQTTNRSLSLIVAGLNSSCADNDRFNGKQNPLFGIISQIYLKGLSESETRSMINKLAKISSASFDDAAITHLFRSYGGHPLMTRLACSFELEYLRAHGSRFPAKISLGTVEINNKSRDRELIFYTRHIINELEDYYPDEYKLLEKLAAGDILHFTKATSTSTAGVYLHKYGIVGEVNGTPYITINVVAEYLAYEDARKNDRPTFFPIVAPEDRKDFLRTRIDNIINDMRLLEKKIKGRTYLPSLFGPNSFPFADRLVKIEEPTTWDSFDKNIDPFHLAFVESIDVYGASTGKRDYFWKDIKSAYPVLQKALHRIRLYRINSNHLAILNTVSPQLEAFLSEDLSGTGAEIPERHWVLFQRSIDELFRGIQFEDSRIS